MRTALLPVLQACMETTAPRHVSVKMRSHAHTSMARASAEKVVRLYLWSLLSFFFLSLHILMFNQRVKYQFYNANMKFEVLNKNGPSKS